tara:strand:- start:77 stop:829 length:753 start_codon:yes stop_codon:yes gene_type:complete
MSDNNYIDELNKYFKLKNSYDEKINNDKQSIINNKELTTKEKQQKFNQSIKKCINCKQPGGTLFTHKDNTFKAICGNTKNPCDLNIIVKRQQKTLITEKILEYMESLNELKTQIILTKLNFIFNYTSEDNSITEFNQLKEKLNILSEKYTLLYKQYLTIINNLEKIDTIKIKLIDKEELINQIKFNMNLFKSTNNISYVKEVVEIYINDLKTIITELNTLQYNLYIIEKVEDENYLLKDKYSIKDLEINL